MRNQEEIERIPAATQPLPVEPDGEAPIALLVSPQERVLTTRQLAWRRFRRHKLAIGSLIVLILIGLATLLVPLISQYRYDQLNLFHRLQGPNTTHWLGTDNLGRDEFTRLLYGGRISLMVGLSVAISAGIIGAVVGAFAGFYGGWIDNALMRVTDLFLAMPFLVVLIIAAKALGGSVFDIVVILSMFFWMPDARIVRGVFLSMKEKEFVEAARASGGSDRRI